MTRRRERNWAWSAAAAAGLAVVGLAGCVSTGPAAPAAPLAAPPPAARPAARQETSAHGYFLYTVRKGDTLFSLARRFGVTVQEVEDDNDITAPRELAVGTLLFIRRVEGVEPPPSGTAGEAPASSSGGLRRAVPAAQLNRGKPGAPFWWPTAGALARRYGEQFHGMADPGIAISAPAGTEVCAVADGTVVSVVLGGDNPQSVWGNVVSIGHAGTMTSWYGHLARVLVNEGARVSKGEAIGTVGQTGAAPEPMLAFRLYRNNRPVDPLSQLP